jgi:ankyrin repeat protein
MPVIHLRVIQLLPDRYRWKTFKLSAILLSLFLSVPALPGDTAKEAYKKKDYNTVQQLAIQGDASALGLLGKMYLNGEGLPKDEQRAFQYALQAAELNDANGCNVCGVCAAEGRGTVQDKGKALQYFRRGTFLGSEKAAYNASWLLLNGDGVPRDVTQGLKYLDIAAKAGYAPAYTLKGAYFLSQAFAYAEGYKDGAQRTHYRPWEYGGWKDALSAFKQGAELGDAGAVCSLAFMVVEEDGYQDSAMYVAAFMRAARQGEACGMFGLGMYYLTARSGRNYIVSIYWLTKAMDTTGLSSDARSNAENAIKTAKELWQKRKLESGELLDSSPERIETLRTRELDAYARKLDLEQVVEAASSSEPVTLPKLQDQSPTIENLGPEGRKILNNALCEAAAKAKVEVIEAILARGAEINAKGEDGRSALMEAAWSGRTDVVRFLLAHGADAKQADSGGQDALHRAAQVCRSQSDSTAPDPHLSGSGSIALLVQAGADVNGYDYSGRTPLHCAVVSRSVYPDILQALFDAGADPNMANRSGETPLNIAVSHSNPEAVKALIHANARINAKDKDGKTALWHAMHIVNLPEDIIPALKAAGGKYDMDPGKTSSASSYPNDTRGQFFNKAQEIKTLTSMKIQGEERATENMLALVALAKGNQSIASQRNDLLVLLLDFGTLGSKYCCQNGGNADRVGEELSASGYNGAAIVWTAYVGGKSNIFCP